MADTFRMDSLSRCAVAVRPHLLAGLAMVCVAVAIVVAGCSAYTSEPESSSTSGTSSSSSRPVPRPVPTSGSAPVARTVIPGIAGEPDVRIRILESAQIATISTTLRTVWVTSSTDPRRPAARVFAPVEVKLTDAGWLLTDPSGLAARYPRNASLSFAGEEGAIGAPTGEQPTVKANPQGAVPPAPLAAGGAAIARPAPGAGSMLYVNGKAYSGTLRCSTKSESARAFDVVESTTLEEYLKGVVTSEMYAGWPAEAYRAQAIAARSYALHERARRRAMSAPFDLDASPAKDQAYAGTGQNPLAAQAVVDTRGIVLTWSGAPLRAYYSSTCGGRPASARDTWATDANNAFNLAGPLQTQGREFACQNASLYRWTAQRTRADLAARFAQFGREKRLPIASITGVESIRPAGVNVAGRPNRFLIIQPGGQSYTLSAEDLRFAANSAAPGQPAITSQTRINSSDFEPVTTGSGFTFSGRGFGHGVGLCQHCAKGFADRGETWPMMLERFYPGAKAERAY
ncbi:MAG: SpoIID/LytB domain-containing protein [Phycisphaerales bacterium]